MRVARLLATAALTSIALGAGAGAALADDQASLSINPSPGVPGSTVVVSVSGGCTASSATATSDAFTASVPLSTGSARIYTGTATIKSTATAGTHSVNVDCPGGGTSTYAITVGSSTTVKGVRGGLGGSVDGMNTTELAAGSALLAAAVVGGVFVVRRRMQN
ncbi:hypothetical protein P8605_22550 [Streptomyces sp. T-3]|nr:hypothetical protein [Streptomyces sp. T-3]